MLSNKRQANISRYIFPIGQLYPQYTFDTHIPLQSILLSKLFNNYIKTIFPKLFENPKD